MPYNNRRSNTRRTSRNRRNTSRRNGFTSIEQFAYKMGQVERAGPNSRVRESFERGKMARKKKEKKPLF